MRSRIRWLPAFVAAAALAAAACGDPNTTDTRGYTKAPLEDPGLRIRGEGSSAMDSLGSPLLPRDTVIPPPTVTAQTTQ